VTASVSPGQHRVYLKVDWCRSPTVDCVLADGERALFLCEPAGRPWRTVLDATVGYRRYIDLREWRFAETEEDPPRFTARPQPRPPRAGYYGIRAIVCLGACVLWVAAGAWFLAILTAPLLAFFCVMTVIAVGRR